MCESVDEVGRAVLARNDGLAAHLREELTGRGVSVVNLLSSPGSGKTELLGRVLARAGGQVGVRGPRSARGPRHVREWERQLARRSWRGP